MMCAAVKRQWLTTAVAISLIGGGLSWSSAAQACTVTTPQPAKPTNFTATVNHIGAAGNTLIVFTSDDGDSLGERGLFFKMSFFEWSVRVPLILHAPFAFGPRRVRENVSHLDLFPTLLELTGDGELPELALPIDGRSLIPIATGPVTDWPDTVLAEYTAEGVTAPMAMVRKGRHKLITSSEDPPLLFDLELDPDETRNLAGDAGSADVQADLEAVAAATWDISALGRTVRQAQAARRVVGGTLATGAHRSWDYQPMRDASRTYYREEGDVREAYSGSIG